VAVCIPDLCAPSMFEPTPVSQIQQISDDDFRLQWWRFQFDDFSGGDFIDHGEFSNMGLKATKKTTPSGGTTVCLPPTCRDC
jgi:hypothetical protein